MSHNDANHDGKVIGSGVAHSVTTNEHTKNAINPHNTFMDVPPDDAQPTAESAPVLTPPPPSQRIRLAQSETLEGETNHVTRSVDTLSAHDPLTTSKQPVVSNIQHISQEALIDREKFHESLTRLEEKLHQLKAKQVALNRQTVANASYADHRVQMPGSNAIGDTRATFDGGRHIESRSVYLEKKNIQDNRQYVSHDAPDLEPPNLERPLDIADGIALPSQGQAKGVEPVEHLAAEVDANDALLARELNDTDEAALRERIRAMKERLQRANQTLVQTEIENDKVGFDKP